ncbi:MAG: DUF58 domain-containing protein [Oscillospiraceae bacterium]|nr:DUF58 domain-containing protein [Oscillospiraceae bacterium]
MKRTLKAIWRGTRRGAKAVWKWRRIGLKILLVALVVVVCAVPAIYTNSLTGYLPIFFLALLLLLAGIYMLVLTRCISCQGMSLTAACRRTEEQEFCMTVQNRSPLICPVAVARLTMFNSISAGGTDTELPLSLGPFEKREFRFSVTFAHLGEYQVGISAVEIMGLLGLLTKRLPGGGIQTVQVTPQRCHPSQLALTRIVENENSQAKTSVPVDGMDYTSVRQYEPGDPMKNIHWKLSAHANGYMTKQTEIYGSSGVDVILDLVSPPWEGEDGAYTYDALIECACASVIYAAENGMEGSLCFLDRTNRERKELCSRADDFDKLMDELPGITDRENTYQLDRLLVQAARGMYTRNNVVLCTSRMNEMIVQRLEQIQMSRRNPVVIYVLPPGLDEKEREDRIAVVRMVSQKNIACYMLTDVLELGKEGTGCFVI